MTAIGIGAVLAVVALLAQLSYHAIFTLLNTQDDDGYLIASLREFADGGALYTDVYSQYGPGLSTLVGGLSHVLDLPLHNDNGRLINLALWLGSAALAGLVLLRLTRNIAVAVAGTLVCWVVLQADANEPLHPGALIGFLLLALVAALALVTPARLKAPLAVAGAIVALLLSIKVNVGVFALAAIVVAAICSGERLRNHRGAVVAAAAVALLPVLVLSSHLDSADTARLAALVCLGTIGLEVVLLRLPAEHIPSRAALGAFAGGLAAVIVLVTAVPLLGGTSPSDLLDGWIVEPAGTAEIQFVPAEIHAYAPILAALGIACAIAAAARIRSARPLAPSAHAAVGAVRLAFGIVVWIALSKVVFGSSPSMTAITLAAPFAWIVAIPPPDSKFSSPFVRAAIPALALLQILHAFPVPGSQIAWAQLLFVVVAGVCVHDGVEEILGALGRDRIAAAPQQLALALPALAVGVWLWLSPVDRVRDIADLNYGVGTSIGLPGASRIHVGAEHAEQLQAVVRDLQRSCDTYISLPGLNSFYVWSGQPIPTVLSGPWAFFFDDERQNEILDEVRAIPRLCALRNAGAMKIWRIQTLEPASGPLVDFIDDCFRTIADRDGYLVQVRRSQCARSHTAAG